MSIGPASNIYIALVEDDESLCRSFTRLLRAAGFQAVTYPSAEAFLADAKRPRFDCLVLDVQFPDMSGLELHRQLTSLGSTTPVIFITAHEDPEVKTLALTTAGCAGYFRKTESGQVVIDAIKQAVSAIRKTI
jgi:FixJ family two-component response regulator